MPPSPEVSIRSPVFMLCFSGSWVIAGLPSLLVRIPLSELSPSVTATLEPGERIVATRHAEPSTATTRPTRPLSQITASFVLTPRSEPAPRVKPPKSSVAARRRTNAGTSSSPGALLFRPK